MKRAIAYQIRYKLRSKTKIGNISGIVISDEQAIAVALANKTINAFLIEKNKEGKHFDCKIEKVTRFECDFFLIDDKKPISEQ